MAEIFPAMSESEFQQLVDDIRENGQREPIWIYQNKIIDGRNRYNACQVLDLEPSTREWSGHGSLINFVVSLNLHRRHLNDSQRAMVARKLATIRSGDNQFQSKEGSPIGEMISQPEAAELLNVSERSISRASKILRDGVHELVEKVEHGELSLAQAEKISSLPKGKQMRILRRGGRKIIDSHSPQKIKKTRHEPIHFCLLCNKDLALNANSFLDYVDKMSERFGGIYAKVLQNAAEEFVGIENLPDIQDLDERIKTAFSYGIHEFNDLVKFTQISRDVLGECLRVGITNHFYREEPQGGKTEKARGARKRLFFPLEQAVVPVKSAESCSQCYEKSENLRVVGSEKICLECLREQRNETSLRDFRQVLQKYNYRDPENRPLTDYENFFDVIENEDDFADPQGNQLTRFVVYKSLREEYMENA